VGGENQIKVKKKTSYYKSSYILKDNLKIDQLTNAN
jgi:hypothetical protein